MEHNHDQKTLGILVEQGRWVVRELHEIKVDLKELKSSHLALKWKIAGAASLFGFLASILVEILRR
jgi:hypothetical protein